MSEQTFDGQFIVVTGGGTGIGRAAATAFAEQGAAGVVITGRRRETLDVAAAAHPALIPVVADVTTAEGANAVADAVRAHGGRLDVLVHNAGIFRNTPLDDLDEAAVREQWETNVIAPTLLTGELLPLLTSPGGNIVVVSSISARMAGPGSSVYSASKAAVDSLIRSWAVELGPRGIRVNGVAPGQVDTPILGVGGMSDIAVADWYSTYAASVPAGRIGRVEDIASWITRLAEPASSFVTGEVITIDGGKLLV
ncbi:SDR family NAD(P)-dependent oxidoreductase [Nocardia acidivorans]|uniref:SDR family NAD(P)-dependent oxidoreductase n=1 Tax=Nocardia acidivorans TaxID=404580 RepID=UPI00083642B8|nr:SDR family oxidoreductase [Nocardia acidivorans]